MRAIVALCVVVFAAGPVFAPIFQPGPPQPTPGWDTKFSNPGNPNFFAPAYPIAFVKAPVVETVTPDCGCYTTTSCVMPPPADCTTRPINPGVVVACTNGNYHLGTDVLSANDPNPGNELWIFLPSTAAVKKLFPRPIHDSTNLIDFTPAEGSVVEPNLSEDGTKIYFSYFQDATDANSTPVESDGVRVPLSGADLYVIDISPLLADPTTSVDSLVTTRLTTRHYISGTHKQLVSERDAHAMNPGLATGTSWTKTDYGIAYLHPIEVRTRHGLYLAYTSNERRLDNSNDQRNRANNNFNLHFRKILADGTLGPEDNQFQYYTTTSALSPTPMRNGLSFSYQATTEDGRNWHIQSMDSEGRWQPLIGYGSNDQLFHLATFCVANEDGNYKDYLVATKYYNVNNEGFGSLWKQDLSIIGKNKYFLKMDGSANFFMPLQDGATELTDPPSAISLSQDDPSPKNPATQEYYGKFTSPRCGGVNQLYFSYTPTSANGHEPDPECNMNLYHAYIGYRPDLEPFTPNDPVPTGHQIVVRKSSNDANLLWAVPIVSWGTRSHGDATQQYTAASIATAPATEIQPGEPFAEVGTSALYNTDRWAYECFMRQPQSGNPNWFTPWGTFGNQQAQFDVLTGNQDGWTIANRAPGTNNFCVTPARSQILGVAVNITSNKTDLTFGGNYVTGSGGPQREAKRLLGVYDTTPQLTQETHQSFRAIIPANVPIEFQAIDAQYGMKLADVRSWHSLKPREVRTSCGGCHQHSVTGSPIPFTGTYADTHPPKNMVASTPSISYDASCNVQVDPVNSFAAKDYPDWSDIWPLMDTYCGSCHRTGGAGEDALSWADASTNSGVTAYNQILNRGYAADERGALGSQLFWAARGRRTDNRDNNAHLADYDCSTSSCQAQSCKSACKWGYYYSSAHDVKCSTPDQNYATWVFNLGKWIDNDLPRNTGSIRGYKFDWYHPTADSALTAANCSLTTLRVGWWDDTGSVSSVKVLRNDTTTLYQNTAAPIANGSAPVTLTGVTSTDWITVEVKDAAGNRQVYRKQGEQLIDDCTP